MPLVEIKAHKSLGTRVEANGVTLPQHLGGTSKVEQIAPVKIKEQQSGAGVEFQVAEGVELAVAWEIGNSQGLRVINANKARIATPVGDIDAAGGIEGGLISGGNKEGIGGGDYGLFGGAEGGEVIAVVVAGVSGG